jgi:hypothetical protein
MLQNVADLTEALEKLKQSGYPINEEDVAHLSPYLHGISSAKGLLPQNMA